MTAPKPTPMSRQESGLRGYLAMVERYGPVQAERWRRRGGRTRNRTWAEIQAGIVPVRERHAPKRKEKTPIVDDVLLF